MKRLMATLTFLSVCWGAPVQRADASTKVAVVNIPTVSEKYEKTADLEAKFDAMRQRANQEREGIRERVDRARRALQEEVKPGTDAYRARMKEIATLEAELQWFTEVEGQRIEQGLADSLRAIFGDIRGAIRDIATERGIDIVLASDELPENTPADPVQVRQHILLQKVLFWNPRIDITEEVISRLNAGYATAGSGGGSREGGRSDRAPDDETRRPDPSK